MASHFNSQQGYPNSMDESDYQQSFHGQKPNQYPASPQSATMPEYPSNIKGYNPPPPPPYPHTAHTGAKPIIADAVNQAFDNSTAANQVPADVIAQITEQVRSEVIDTLRKEFSGAPPGHVEPPHSQRQPYPTESERGVNVPIPSAAQTQSFGPGLPFSSGPGPHLPQPDAAAYGTSPGKSSRPIHTPPTPERESDDTNYFSQTESRDRKTSTESSQDHTSSRPISIPHSSNQSTSPARSSIMREDLTSRYGERTRERSTGPGQDRPIPVRVRTNDEETVIEKMWQTLFDMAGKPTTRAGQFLRGIALQLIEEYEPKDSLVIGPYKMKKYFEHMNSSDDFLPWKDIFMLPSVHLSALYSALSCQHHLIPKSSNPYEAPHLAALTPHGFASFMTLLIQAYPDIEFQRLSDTVRDWPVSNADDRTYRWPKELSRRLLPRAGAENERRLLLDALRHAGVNVPSSARSAPSMQPGMSSDPGAFGYSSSAPPSGYVPPPPPASAPPTHHQSSHSRSYRNKYPGPSASGRDYQDKGLDHNSDDGSTHSVTIERERKPYVAREGAGKTYEEPLERVKSASNAIPSQSLPPLNTRDRSSNQPSAASHSQYNPTPSSASSGPGRTRDRGSSISHSMNQDSYAGRDAAPGYQRSSRARSPSYGQPTYGRGSGDRVDGASNGSSGYYEDERYYDRDRIDRVTSREEDERERERRYAKYDEEYRRGTGGPSNTYAGGNPPLGTGERRY